MVPLIAVDNQNPCWFYHIKLLNYASSRFTISMSKLYYVKLGFKNNDTLNLLYAKDDIIIYKDYNVYVFMWLV